MSRFLAAATLAASVAARFPAQPGVVDSIEAGADSGPIFPEFEPEEGVIDDVKASGVKSFNTVAGKLQYVKATEHFYVAGEPIYAGDYVEVTEGDAIRLRNAGRAEFATDEQVAAAQAAEAKAAKK